MPPAPYKAKRLLSILVDEWSARTSVSLMTSLCVALAFPGEAGISHSIATITTNAAVISGEKAFFDRKTQKTMVGGKPFKPF